MKESNIHAVLPEGKFTFRAVALIIRDGMLLTAKNEKHDCFYLPGGGVHFGETAEEAIIREMREETGAQLEIDRLAFVQERFYESAEIKRHELAFFYLMNAENANFEEGMPTDSIGEILHWLKISELKDVNLIPNF